MSSVADLMQQILRRLNSIEESLSRLQNNKSQYAECLSQIVDDKLNKRRIRDSIFPHGYFADAAWDLLLELFQARLRGEKCSVSDLGLSANIPPTTAIRYIDKLVQDGFAERQPDPTDRRRIFVKLTECGTRAVSHALIGTAADPILAATHTSKPGATFIEYYGNSVFATSMPE